MSGSIVTSVDDVSCPRGFVASGVSCGIKPSGAPDLALIHCAGGASAAGVFTTNLLQAAPITVSRGHLRESGGRARAVLINSGCANAATGAEGVARARRTAERLAAELGPGVHPRDVLVNSTGVIGVALPEEKIAGAVPGLVRGASPDGLQAAARAIMTTDLVPKAAMTEFTHAGRTCRVAGIAKGSGMIHPNMATMIAVLLTDAAVEPGTLDAMLRRATDASFHRISVDGDTSTNDSVFLLASGSAGEFPGAALGEAITLVARELALMVVRDGEGARKVIAVRVLGGADDAEALRVARTVAASMLVRTAVAGGDPNWGRIVAAVGRAGVPLDMDRITVRVRGGDSAPAGLRTPLTLFARGAPAGTDREALRAVFNATDVVIEIDLARGAGRDEFYTCDLTEGYIQINAHYTT